MKTSPFHAGSVTVTQGSCSFAAIKDLQGMTLCKCLNVAGKQMKELANGTAPGFRPQGWPQGAFWVLDNTAVVILC